MDELSPTLVSQGRQLKARHRAIETGSLENLEVWLNLSKKLSKTAREELSQLQRELHELTTAAINLSYSLDEDLEELAMREQVDFNFQIEAVTERFCEVNDIRVGVEQDILRAEQLLSAKSG